MIKNITIGQYVPGDSPVHKMDPRAKIGISFLFMISIFFVNNFLGYLFFGGFILGAIMISKLKASFIIKGLKPILFILIFTALINIFVIKGVGDPLFKLGFLTIYKEGLVRAAFMGIRLVLLIIGTSILTLTTSPIELTDGIEYMLNPFKKIGLPAHELAMMMTIALRFIPTLMDETDKIMKAQMARGADFENGKLIDRAKNLVPILVPLFINSFKRADDLATAMEARAYRGGEGRTRMKILKYHKRDLVGLVVFVFSVILAVGTRFFVDGVF